MSFLHHLCDCVKQTSSFDPLFFFTPSPYQRPRVVSEEKLKLESGVWQDILFTGKQNVASGPLYRDYVPNMEGDKL